MRKALFLLFLSSALPSFAQTAKEKGLSAITKENAMKHIAVLAHDSLDGREAGTSGGLKASYYLRSEFEETSIKPWRGKYFQSFSESPHGRNSNKKPNMQNILGYIEGKNNTEIVIVGAHYDHLGIRGNGTNDNIYNGADDNATGTSAILQIAKAFVASGEKPGRTIIFALWDGEEIGLLGSFYFVKDHASYIPIPLSAPPVIRGYVNLDMIGRNNNEVADSILHVKCTIAESKPVFKDWIKEDIDNHNLELNPEYVYLEKESRRMNSDHAPFFFKGIPIIYYNTGLHQDYHQVSDHADKINYEKVAAISKLAFLNVWNMANIKDY
ncbi:MAG: M28 family peptidase [Prevotella sp.]|jgi:Zn-dependent M28 family amino/carboxypeptidase|nr:M28 family peptidase [Prevotella sp.]